MRKGLFIMVVLVVILEVLRILTTGIVVRSWFDYNDRYIDNLFLVDLIHKDLVNGQCLIIDENNDDHFVLNVFRYWYDETSAPRAAFDPDDCLELAERIAYYGKVDEEFILTFNFSNGMIIEFSDCRDKSFRSVLIDCSKAKGIVTPVISNFCNYDSFEQYQIYGSLLMFARLLECESPTSEDMPEALAPDFGMIENAIHNNALIITDEYTLNESFSGISIWSKDRNRYSLNEAINEVSGELGLLPNIQVFTNNQRDYELLDRKEYYRTHPNLYESAHGVNSYWESNNLKDKEHSKSTLENKMNNYIVANIFISVLQIGQIILLVNKLSSKET